MDKFIARFGSLVTATLSGFDRLVFRGHLQPLHADRGMYAFLCRAGVRLLDFKRFVTTTSERLKNAALAPAHRRDRPIRYLASSATSKEDLAKQLLAEHPVDRGLVCVRCPCRSQQRDWHRWRSG
jgi:hypothetical protein